MVVMGCVGGLVVWWFGVWSLFVVLVVCCARCLLCSLFVVLAVCCARCLLCSLFVVLVVCCVGGCVVWWFGGLVVDTGSRHGGGFNGLVGFRGVVVWHGPHVWWCFGFVVGLGQHVRCWWFGGLVGWLVVVWCDTGNSCGGGGGGLTRAACVVGGWF